MSETRQEAVSRIAFWLGQRAERAAWRLQGAAVRLYAPAARAGNRRALARMAAITAGSGAENRYMEGYLSASEARSEGERDE